MSPFHWLAGNRRIVLATTLGVLQFLAGNARAQSRFGDNGARDREFGISQWQDASRWTGNFPATGIPEWKLGVEADNTETGVVIRQVKPGSAASRMGFQPGDVIVAVNGFQVGIVNDGLYDLREELARRADREGFVSLLVHDHINRSLHKVQVRLDGSQSVLRGDLIYRERYSMPPDAIVTVNIENASRPFALVRNGQAIFRPSPGASTIPFEINYDPAYIFAQDVYQIRATVSSGGQTILETRQPARVLTQGSPSQVQLALTPTSNFGTANAVVGSPSQVITAGYPNLNLNTALQQRVAQAYRQYLERDPFPIEWASWTLTPGPADRVANLPLELMASQEYFDKVGNNNSLWFASIYRAIIGRQPNQEEVDKWMIRFNELRNSRTELLRQLYVAAASRR